MNFLSLKKHVESVFEHEKNDHTYRAIASFSMLEHVDLMIDKYLTEDRVETGAVLLDVFGLLQGLFVAIDALYDLAIGLTRHKYHINVNANPILHELKYIRNDVVGHPTHRTYPNGGTGFSMIDTENMTKSHFQYKTYVFERSQMEVKSKSVYIKPLLEAYQQEKKQILKNIHNYLIHKDEKQQLSDRAYVFYQTLSKQELAKVKNHFIQIYETESTASHRFLWRIGLIEELLDWQEGDVELEQFLFYLTKVQAAKLYEIALNLENTKGLDAYTPIPKLLNTFYKFISKHESIAVDYLQSLHDLMHPMHQSDILALYALKPSQKATKLLDFLNQQTSESKVYLIGSALRNYRPKKKINI